MFNSTWVYIKKLRTFTGIEHLREETKQLQEYVRQAHIAVGHIKE